MITKEKASGRMCSSLQPQFNFSPDQIISQHYLIYIHPTCHAGSSATACTSGTTLHRNKYTSISTSAVAAAVAAAAAAAVVASAVRAAEEATLELLLLLLLLLVVAVADDGSMPLAMRAGKRSASDETVMASARRT